MAAVAVQPGRVRPRWNGVGLRWRVVLTSSLVVLVAFLIGARLLHEAAVQKQHDVRHDVEAAAMAASTSFDREVAAASYLLLGLSKAPSLIAGDSRAFYDQLVATPKPEGSWFILWDQDGQVLNTLRPFGTPLPRRSEWPAFEAGWNRLRDRGISVTSRSHSPLGGIHVIAVAVRIDDADGRMKGFLTANIPETRLAALVRDRTVPEGWLTTVFDRNQTPAVITDGSGGASRVMPGALQERLRNTVGASSGTGHDRATDLFFAFQRSGSTDFVTATTVPASLIEAPVAEAKRTITWAGLTLLLAAAAAGFALVRQVGPVEASAAETASRLRLAEARYASLWNDTSESLFVVTVTPDGRFVFEGLNPAHERATGLTFEAVAGKEPEQCLPPKPAAAVMARYRACLERGAPMIYDEVLDLPGGRRYWQTSLAPVRDPETRTIVALIGTARDVTLDREARERVESSQRLLQATLDALSAHIAILDEAGTVIAVNRAWHRFAESRDYATPDHGVGTNYVETCRRAASTDPEADLVARNLDAILASRKQEFRLSYGCGDRFFQMRAARFTYEGTAHVVVAHEDVTELTAARQDVRDIAGRLLSLQEEERQRIAADLHDSTAQHIVAASLGLMGVQAVAGDPQGVERAVALVRTSLDEAQKEVRTLSYLLYPPDLRTRGLAASLRHFVAGFSQRTGLQGTARVTGDIEGVRPDVQRALLRVVQEALGNVHRHAEASKVSVTLRRDAQGLHLRVSDNGKGLPGGQNGLAAPASLGVGIPGMEARIRQFNGTMVIASGLRGTTIRATIPVLDDHGQIQRMVLGPERDRIELSHVFDATLRVSPDGHGEQEG
ncbi:PAS domain-containing protein [Microvirga sp. 0TCS3.31]